jgi:hypothetical protein
MIRTNQPEYGRGPAVLQQRSNETPKHPREKAFINKRTEQVIENKKMS